MEEAMGAPGNLFGLVAALCEIADEEPAVISKPKPDNSAPRNVESSTETKESTPCGHFRTFTTH
jgi:hypothetical protein